MRRGVRRRSAFGALVFVTFRSGPIRMGLPVTAVMTRHTSAGLPPAFLGEAVKARSFA